MNSYKYIFGNPVAPITNKLDFICLKMFYDYGRNIKEVVIEDLSIKRKFYKDERYLSELEKEYVYFYESTKLFIEAMTHYLITGLPNIKSAEIEDFACSDCFSPSKDTVLFHLKYLHSDHNECSVNDEHKDYKDMKWCRIHLLATGCYGKSLKDNYVEEQVINFAALILFKTVLKYRRYFAGVCSKDSPENVLDIVKPRVRFYGLACIGEVPINGDSE